MSGKAPSDGSWFADAADSQRYLGEVGRLWAMWLVGLGALAVARGGVAIVAGVLLLVAMFVLMSPLQQRVQDRYEGDDASRRIPSRQTLSSRDRGLRQLTYGHSPFAEAVEKRGLPAVLKAVPWVVRIVTLAAAAVVALQWFGG